MTDKTVKNTTMKNSLLGVISLAMAGSLSFGSVSASDAFMMEEQRAEVQQADYAAQELAAKDWDAAIVKLEAIKNDDPFRLLNLAAAYKNTGRLAEAKALYNRVLAMKKNPYANLGASVAPRRVKSLAKKAVTAMNEQQ